MDQIGAIVPSPPPDIFFGTIFDGCELHVVSYYFTRTSVRMYIIASIVLNVNKKKGRILAAFFLFSNVLGFLDHPFINSPSTPLPTNVGRGGMGGTVRRY